MKKMLVKSCVPIVRALETSNLEMIEWQVKALIEESLKCKRYYS